MFFEEWGFSQDPFEPTALPASPLGRTLLVGRDAALQGLKSTLRATRSIATLEGPNGVGKTSLANVAAYSCFEEHLDNAIGGLLIPCNRPFQVPADDDPGQFVQEVLMEVAQTLISRRRDLEDAGRKPSGLRSLDRWLNSAQISAWQTALGAVGGSIGLGRSTSINEAAGYERSGLRREVLSVLNDTFSAGEGVVCVIDNIELLESSDRARRLLDRLRDELLHVPGLRWILAGAGGIIESVVASPRLDGFLSTPIAVGGVATEYAPQILESRIRAFAQDRRQRPYLPIVPEDFAALYALLAFNIRSTLGRVRNYCESCASTSAPRTVVAKRAAFAQWLNDESGRALEAAERLLSPRAWKVFDTAARELFGFFSPSEFSLFGFNAAPNLRVYVKDLEEAGLVRAIKDDSDKRRKTVQIVAKGWLVNYARTNKYGA